MPNALGYDVGRDRSRAIYRGIAALLFFTVAAPIWAFLTAVAIVAGVVIVAVDLVLGVFRNDHWRGGMAKEWADRLFTWPFDILWWIFKGHRIGGGRSFPWLP